MILVRPGLLGRGAASRGGPTCEKRDAVGLSETANPRKTGAITLGIAEQDNEAAEHHGDLYFEAGTSNKGKPVGTAVASAAAGRVAPIPVTLAERRGKRQRLPVAFFLTGGVIL